MYDLSGIYYQLKSDILVFGVVGLLFIISSHFWIIEKRNLKELAIGLICALLCIGSMGYHLYIIRNLQVSVHEGFFLRENRANPSIFRMEYSFTNENGLKPIFYLDVFSKKTLYPEKMSKEIEYRIYYEEKTNIIVRIEKIEE